MADKIMEQALEILRHQRYYDSIQGLMGWDLWEGLSKKGQPYRGEVSGYFTRQALALSLIHIYPYGHERLECVSALVLGIVLLFTGLGVGKAGVETILAGNYQNLEAPGAIALLAAILSIGGKEWMYWYTRYHAKRIRSQAFLADAWHHRSDAFSSVGSLVGIGGAMLGFPVLDSLASVVICLFIVKVAYDITRDALVKMLDTSWDKAEEEAIRQYVSSMDQVERVDRLRTRMFGSRVYVDLEIAVNGDKSLREAHGVAERVHRQVEEQFQDVKHIMVHVNPAPQTGN